MFVYPSQPSAFPFTVTVHSLAEVIERADQAAARVREDIIRQAAALWHEWKTESVYRPLPSRYRPPRGPVEMRFLSLRVYRKAVCGLKWGDIAAGERKARKELEAAAPPSTPKASWVTLETVKRSAYRWAKDLAVPLGTTRPSAALPLS